MDPEFFIWVQRHAGRAMPGENRTIKRPFLKNS